MEIGVPKEIHDSECRVATTPEVVGWLKKLGFDVSVEANAGAASNYTDEAYRDAGAEIIADTRGLWNGADIVLKVRAPESHRELGVHESELLNAGSTLISFIWPAQNADLMERLAGRKVTALAMDSVPRISRAQKLDALSSMANIAGYRAVIEAANHFGRFFTGQVTAAGKVPPAKVMIIGAGVAGLAAIGAASSMGAIVRAFDTRPEVKEQVQSLDAEFLELEFDNDEAGGTAGGYAKVMSEEFIKAEMDLFLEQAKEVDIIITTALIPGKPAPKLITAEMVQAMAEGSVIVDLAGEQGGNCALTKANEVVVEHGVTIIGYTDLPSRLSTVASQLYSTNIRHLLTELCPEKDGELVVNMEDDVIRGSTVVNNGEITWPPPEIKVSAAPAKAVAAPAKIAKVAQEAKPPALWKLALVMALAAAGLYKIGAVAPPEFMSHLTVFVLSCFVGYQVIWNVTAALHTPLMSCTNAISGIIVIGALVQVSTDGFNAITLLSAIAIAIASINIWGGFAVTQRMLQMFRK